MFGLVGAGTGIVAFRRTGRRSVAERRRDLAPDWRVSLKRRPGTDDAVLTLVLDGPDELGQVDKIRLEIRDDRHDRQSPFPAEDVAQVIWGPYRVMQGISGRDELGRTLEHDPLPVGEKTDIWLESTVAPPWYTGGATKWRRDWDGKPLRVRILAWRDKFEPWVKVAEVTDPTPQVY